MVDMIVFQSLKDIIDFYKFIHIYCSGRNSTFLIWKANLDYSKSNPDSVRTELTMMLGEIAAKGEMEKKNKSFSYKPSVGGVDTPSGKTVYADSDRYGDYLAKVMKFE